MSHSYNCEILQILTYYTSYHHLGNEYTLILDETELEVRINVSNLADSAYEAQLFIAHQAGVSYVATKKPVSGYQKLRKFFNGSIPYFPFQPTHRRMPRAIATIPPWLPAVLVIPCCATPPHL